MLYDSLSAASHGDIRYALIIAQGPFRDLATAALSDAASASIVLLIATSIPLGFHEECEVFLETAGLGRMA